MFITHRRFPFVVSSLWTFPSFKYFMCQVGFFSSEADKQLQYLLFFIFFLVGKGTSQYFPL